MHHNRRHQHYRHFILFPALISVALLLLSQLANCLPAAGYDSALDPYYNLDVDEPYYQQRWRGVGAVVPQAAKRFYNWHDTQQLQAHFGMPSFSSAGLSKLMSEKPHRLPRWVVYPPVRGHHVSSRSQNLGERNGVDGVVKRSEAAVDSKASTMLKRGSSEMVKNCYFSPVQCFLMMDRKRR